LIDRDFETSASSNSLILLQALTYLLTYLLTYRTCT